MDLQLGSAPDGWNLFVAERDALFDFISSNCISGVVLLSGVPHKPLSASSAHDGMRSPKV